MFCPVTAPSKGQPPHSIIPLSSSFPVLLGSPVQWESVQQNCVPNGRLSPTPLPGGGEGKHSCLPVGGSAPHEKIQGRPKIPSFPGVYTNDRNVGNPNNSKVLLLIPAAVKKRYGSGKQHCKRGFFFYPVSPTTNASLRF